jgi:hypothetical protein
MSSEACLGGCPTIAFYCDRLQIPSPALERPKHPQRSIDYACGDFALSALSTIFSLDLVANTIIGQPPRAGIVGLDLHTDSSEYFYWALRVRKQSETLLLRTSDSPKGPLIFADGSVMFGKGG